MKGLSSLFVPVLTILSFTSCEDEPGGEPIIPASTAKVLVSCEGGFGSSNASLSSYDPISQEASLGAFEAVNGYVPGDVLQSIGGHMDKLFLVLNGSTNIEVIDEESLVAESPINGAISPRAILPLSESKAYVSNLFSNALQVIDLDTKTIASTIDIGGWSEGMARVGDEVFVSRNNGTKLMVIDIQTDEVADSIEIGNGPKDVLTDLNGHIWTLNIGYDANFNVSDARIHQVDPETRDVLASYPIPQPWSYKMDLRIDSGGTLLYILNNSVYSMGIAATEVSQDPIIDNGFSNYGLGIDPDNGELYVGYAPDFSSEGTVFRYTGGGELLDEFQVGIAPNGFHFRD